jgi:hypothetical protein
MAAVQSALDAGLFYTSAVLAHCIDFLGVTAEQAAVNTQRVEGGNIGMDCYYARNCIEAKRGHEAERLTLFRLNPHVGKLLGTLVFSDMKRCTGMTITAISSGSKLFDISGKRGSHTVNCSCTARQIESAMNRAFEIGARKNDFKAFCAPSAVTTENGLFATDSTIG